MAGRVSSMPTRKLTGEDRMIDCEGIQVEMERMEGNGMTRTEHRETRMYQCRSRLWEAVVVDDWVAVLALSRRTRFLIEGRKELPHAHPAVTEVHSSRPLEAEAEA